MNRQESVTLSFADVNEAIIKHVKDRYPEYQGKEARAVLLTQYTVVGPLDDLPDEDKVRPFVSVTINKDKGNSYPSDKLVFTKEFVEALKELCENEYDEVINVVDEEVKDDFTRGYIKSLIEGEWVDQEYDELCGTLIWFAEQRLQD